MCMLRENVANYFNGNQFSSPLLFITVNDILLALDANVSEQNNAAFS